MTTPPSSLTSALDSLASTFGGRAILPDDAAFEEARRVHNGLIDKRPALILQCGSTEDVVEAVRLGRETGLEVAVRGGGHNVAGRATGDGVLMIDLSPMKAIRVQRAAGTATAQGGVTWGEFNQATQSHGLATTGGVVSTTGVAGLTLGGGIGHLMGKYGLSIDNLRSVEVVTAAGDVITASHDDHPDLFWGLRGGGGNFGVATTLEYNLHRVGPMVTGGLIAWPLSAGRDVFRFWRDLTQSLPDEMVSFAGLVHAPDGSGTKLAAIVVCHCGALSEGAEAVRPIKEFGTPAVDRIGPIGYCDANQILDDGYPKGALNYWKASFIDELSDDAIDAMVDRFESCPVSMSSILLEHLHGAVARVGPTDTAFAHRAPGYNCGLITEWMDPSETNRCVQWTRDAYRALSEHMSSGRYVNYLGDDEASEAVAAAYGPNLPRLRTLKAKYDPTNFFHMNQNIPPA